MSKKATDFINKYRVNFGVMERLFDIPAKVLLAMAANETGWGSSKKFKKTNNMFGFKAKTKYDNCEFIESEEFINGKKYKIKSYFKKYSIPSDSILDAALRISNNDIYFEAYMNLKKYRTTNKDKYLFKGIDLLSSEWATDPNYSKKIKNIIKRNYVVELLKW